MASSDEVMGEMLEELAQSLDGIQSPNSLMSFLGQATVLWRYSASNIAMLAMQGKARGLQPTLVAGFNEWKREGRTPRTGQRGLKILVPTASRRYELKTVFDVTQTEGTPIALPSTQLPEAVAAATLYSRLAELCEDLGFEVRESSIQRGCNAVITMYDDRLIIIDNRLPLTERIEVLAHNYGHAALHGPDDPLSVKYADGAEHHGLAEVEAEAVAYVLLKAHGIDSTMRSSEYLAGWSDAVLEAAPLLSKEDEPPKHSDIVGAVLSRITGASKTALMATDPPGYGGKPAHRHLDLDAGAMPAPRRDVKTGPAVQPGRAHGIGGPATS
ncbi:MAG TPA: ArdC-like ssDNA-binding domain-containing protein [Mycobacterium sp.]